jgi:hypothetical protein
VLDVHLVHASRPVVAAVFLTPTAFAKLVAIIAAMLVEIHQALSTKSRLSVFTDIFFCISATNQGSRKKCQEIPKGDFL